jgi:hypothetical protein
MSNALLHDFFNASLHVVILKAGSTVSQLISLALVLVVLCMNSYSTTCVCGERTLEGIAQVSFCSIYLNHFSGFPKRFGVY